VSKGWIGVDLDGTLAEYHGWVAPDEIGKPVPKMVERVKQWLAEGKDVRIFTARIGVPDGSPYSRAIDALLAEMAIYNWCEEVFGQKLPVTCTKDYEMLELWDDRCKQVIPNTGVLLEDRLGLYKEMYQQVLQESV
jgi:hypothetical protein